MKNKCFTREEKEEVLRWAEDSSWINQERYEDCLLYTSSPVLLLTTLIAASCPVGACCTMFALTYGKDGAYASQIFTVTTLLCIVTIPFVVAAAGIVGIG